MSMNDSEVVTVSVAEFIELLNQTFEYAFPTVVVTGELANYRVSRNKWLYFDLKDEESSMKCFGTVFQLPGPLEDGMMMQVRGYPKMHSQFGYSFNVQTMQPAGEGSIRRAADLLAAKLKAEGLFDSARKRPLPYPPQRIGLITSRQSAAYADFIKVISARWGGLEIELIDVLVQGDMAPSQIVAALERFNALAQPPEVLVLVRGGGSADDLAAFSSEIVIRAVAASRVPVLAAIGHETDISLAELAADGRASTPSNAAELLVPDRRTALETVGAVRVQLHEAVSELMQGERHDLTAMTDELHQLIKEKLVESKSSVASSKQILEVLSPQAALRRGYAAIRKDGRITRGGQELTKGDIIDIEWAVASASAEIVSIRKKNANT